MGHRLSKITTRTGDGGDTGLGDGSRVRKDHPRVAALGEIDELNSAIGLLLAEPVPEQVRASLEGIQHDLFDLGGDVSIPGRSTMTAGQAERLEALLGAMKKARVNLLAFTGFPNGAGAQVDFVPARPAAFARGAKKAGIKLGKKKTAFLVRGEDRVGALVRILGKLAEAKINMVAMDAVTAGGGRYGAIFWVKPKDIGRASRLLGAR